MLPRRTYPKMPLVEEERYPVLFRRNRIVVRRSDHVDRLDDQLAATRRALVLAHQTRHPQRGFRRQMGGRSKRFGAHVFDRGDALADTGAIANQQEMNLPARTPIVEPSTQRYFFAAMATQSIDIDPCHGSSLGASAPLIENRATWRAVPGLFARASARKCTIVLLRSLYGP